jgi:hypothetical protein
MTHAALEALLAGLIAQRDAMNVTLQKYYGIAGELAEARTTIARLREHLDLHCPNRNCALEYERATAPQEPG